MSIKSKITALVTTVALCSIGLALYSLSVMSTYQLIMCSTGEQGFRAPPSACDVYLKQFRYNEQGVNDLAEGGLDPILNLDGNLKYDIAQAFINEGLEVDAGNSYLPSPHNTLTPLQINVITKNVANLKFLLSNGASVESSLDLVNSLMMKDSDPALVEIKKLLSDSTNVNS
ncbi:hypothetical protein [Agarivorans sp. Z349TD_8]|uniref:hypothetical protein n=1 Tax=Agarivorans sp. Z349TD_8 TaxID=3421434 RepID=UPI003D7CBDEF